MKALSKELVFNFTVYINTTAPIQLGNVSSGEWSAAIYDLAWMVCKISLVIDFSNDFAQSLFKCN